MFKFDFVVDEVQEDGSTFSAEPALEIPEINTDNVIKEWYDSEEVIVTTDILENIDVCKLNSVQKEVANVSLSYMVSGFLLENIKENDDQILLDIKKAEDKRSDLIPAEYEGGAKIWECTDDLLKYLDEHFTSAEWEGKSVLDLGCGSGLLGIYAFKNGAKVTFQDYNKDVLEKITIPNVLLNVSEIAEDEEETYNVEKVKANVRFYSGDWTKWCEKTPSDQLYDIILTSETIYNPQNQQKLLNCLCDKIKPDGLVFVAAKTYYFGVGGGLRQFEELIRTDRKFNFKSLWLSKHGVSREIVQLTKIKSRKM